MTKKVLITTFTYPPQRSGVAHVVEAHATGLVRMGHQVTVASGDISGASDESIRDGVRVCRFSVNGNGRWLRGGYEGDVDRYQEFIQSGDWDILICHCWNIWSTDLAVKVFDNVECPKVLVSHGSLGRNKWSVKGLINWLDWLPYKSGMPNFIRRFNHVVLLTDMQNSDRFYDHQLMHKMKYESHSVIPNGINPDRYTNAEGKSKSVRETYGINEKLMILYVSNYTDGKNQRLALESFTKAELEDAVLVFIGSEINDYARECMKGISASSKTMENILFLERLSQADIASFYCAADIFLFTSSTECQPMVILEAMASGTPFLSRDVGCVREFPGGVVVQDDLELSDAIQQLANDVSQRETLCVEGENAIGSHYRWDVVIKKYNALINELCSSER